MPVNIVDYGAVGDGDPSRAAANQAAIQAAFNASNDVYMPGGNYYTLGLTITHDNTKIRGEGDKCQLTYANAGTGTLLDTGNHPVDFDSFKLFGDDLSDKRFLTAPANNRTGLKIVPHFNSRVRNMTIIGFGGFGVDEDGSYYNGAADSETRRLQFSDSFISNCGYGFRICNSGSGEYQALNNLRLTRNAIAYCDRAGNVNATGMIIMDNGVGVEIDGSAYSNNSHSNFSNSLINHSVYYSIKAKRCQVGYNFIGNQIHLGSINIENCVGINIANGTIHVGELRFKGGADSGRCYVRNNFMFTGDGGDPLVNTVIHNDGGVNDAFGVEDNWTRSGAFANSYGGAY